MSRLLNSVLEEIANFNGKVTSPTDDIQEGEEVIGTLKDPNLRKLFTIVGIMTEELIKHQKDLFVRGGIPSSKNYPSGTEINTHNTAVLRLQELEKILMLSIQHEIPRETLLRFPEEPPRIKIRKKWKIVILPQNLSSATMFIGIHI